MSKQVIANIVRPEVRIEYRPESTEAKLPDQLTACKLALHSLAFHMREIRRALRGPYPEKVVYLVQSNTDRRGL